MREELTEALKRTNFWDIEVNPYVRPFVSCGVR